MYVLRVLDCSQSRLGYLSLRQSKYVNNDVGQIIQIGP